MTLFDEMLARYEGGFQTEIQKRNATHEVMQEIALAGLYRGAFFDKAAFYGGTCLRIFHKLPRFSEDMDFSLIEKEINFSIEDYFPFIIKEFSATGKEVVIEKKEKREGVRIESAFLKDDTEIYDLKFRTEKGYKIKIEVDTNPPLGFATEQKLLLQPFSFMTRCYTLPDLYAGKMHALLFRKWQNRVKGRDWFDFEWYVRNNVKLNFAHLQERAREFNELELTKEIFIEMLREHIRTTDIEMVKRDVSPFVEDQSGLDIWSNDYFLQLIDHMKYI